MRTWEDYKKTMKTESPVFELARQGDVEGLRRTVSFNLIDQQDSKGYSPLMLTAYHGHVDATLLLLEAGADPNLTDHSGNTILMGVSFKGHLEIAKLLIEFGAHPDKQNPKGQTALQFAQMFGRTELVLFLKSIQQQPEVFSLKDIFSSWSSYVFSKRSAT